MLEVLYEDNHVIAVVKPNNIPSQADITKDTDMLTLVREYIAEKYSKPGNVYLGLLHRLDRPAGGVMLFAKTSKAAKRLSEDIRENRFFKKYFAVLTNVPAEKSGVLTDYIVKDCKTNISRIAKKTDEGSKKAVLKYKVLSSTKDKSLVLIDLQTGRPHQIRVQFANLGCPLEGDVKYGAKEGHLMLWSCFIGFYHPTKKELIKVCSVPKNKAWNEFGEIINGFTHDF